jgi:DNA-binding phage protein
MDMAKKSNEERKKATDKVKTRVYDTVNYLHDGRDMFGHLEAALMGGDGEVIAAAIRDIRRAINRQEQKTYLYVELNF